jgi:hypothetical protein
VELVMRIGLKELERSAFRSWELGGNLQIIRDKNSSISKISAKLGVYQKCNTRIINFSKVITEKQHKSLLLVCYSIDFDKQ